MNPSELLSGIPLALIALFMVALMTFERRKLAFEDAMAKARMNEFVMQFVVEGLQKAASTAQADSPWSVTETNGTLQAEHKPRRKPRAAKRRANPTKRKKRKA